MNRGAFYGDAIIEIPGGKERWWINRYSPGAECFSIKPIGEVTVLLPNGGVGQGPEIRPN